MIYFIKYLPYNYNGFNIKLLNKNTADKYINNLLTERYNKFNTIDFRSYTYDDLMNSCLSLLNLYANNIPTNDIRLLVYNKNKLISGITIYNEHNEYKMITLGYFIFDEYIGKGYGNMALKSAINYIKYVKTKIDINLDTIVLKIKPKNERSIKIALANNFVKYASNKDFDSYKYTL